MKAPEPGRLEQVCAAPRRRKRRRGTPGSRPCLTLTAHSRLPMPRSHLRCRPMLAALTAIALGAACFQGSGEGPKTPKAANTYDPDAFAVAYAAPSGKTTAAGEITLVM